MKARWQPGTLYQLIFLGLAFAIWGAVGVGGYFGGGIWRFLSGLLLLGGLALAVVAYRRVRR